MTIDTPNSEFVTLKQCEDGRGYILRLKEVAGRAGEAELSFPLLRIDRAYLANGVEDIQRVLPSSQTSVRVPYDRNRYITVRLDLALGDSSPALAKHD